MSTNVTADIKRLTADLSELCKKYGDEKTVEALNYVAELGKSFVVLTDVPIPTRLFVEFIALISISNRHKAMNIENSLFSAAVAWIQEMEYMQPRITVHGICVDSKGSAHLGMPREYFETKA